MELTRNTTPRKGSAIIYAIPGVRGAIKIPRSAFGATIPDTIVEGASFATPKAKLTKEQRAAARAALTPQDKAKLARERADKAMARATKLEKAAAAS